MHPDDCKVWYLIIPFSNGTCSFGVVGEFLDPVFSSGMTIAMKSAELATDLLITKPSSAIEEG
ncbi:FAD dependent oxidoreductase [Moritella viscosa]|uniref:FAD dependent oxidoreductase n=1 Tax=Moritella viscosa TaxID=80854 RepID=A0A1L0AC91_9GAMM|nr:FAD dependent oxidoreductase [Moritella viscosa]SGZ05005.1 FAD dependent oxidoreductase [Moritella viscosa]SGZ11958.1 FAD dependent oxidoreductase [Moritella viscosa]SGZ12119.1 FAD dependent oxidoreductase [Moritella viscosa]SHO27662.1 FAD dependent oxidoreductase [Moritella viscosa]